MEFNISGAIEFVSVTVKGIRCVKCSTIKIPREMLLGDLAVGVVK